jgi:hypothetical protein
MTKVEGYVRPRGGKLQAVITVGSRKVRKATGFDVGQEAEAEAVLAEALAKARAEEPVAGGAGMTREGVGRALDR